MMNKKESGEETRERFRKTMKEFIESYSKIKNFNEFEVLTKRCAAELDAMKRENSRVFNRLYGAYVSVLNAKEVAGGRLTGKPAQRF
ncbi:MAG: hypothetical protein V1492_02535 [Candidatus Micrarchaeota archaeon]